MFKNKPLEYVERAFRFERASYIETIEHLHVRVRELEEELEGVTATTTDDSTNEKIKELELENERLAKELEQCGKKLNATQYKEYKRLKQKEYNQRYLKKKAQKSSK